MTADTLIESRKLPKLDPGKASFTDLTGSLLPLFCDPDGRGNRRWEQMFGMAQHEPLHRIAGAYSALVAVTRR